MRDNRYMASAAGRFCDGWCGGFLTLWEAVCFSPFRTLSSQFFLAAILPWNIIERFIISRFLAFWAATYYVILHAFADTGGQSASRMIFEKKSHYFHLLFFLMRWRARMGNGKIAYLIMPAKAFTVTSVSSRYDVAFWASLHSIFTKVCR